MAIREPTSLRDLLPAVLARLARDSGQVDRLLPVWHETVGAQIARNARPKALQGDVLIVEVAGPKWAQELAAQQQTLCDRLNQRLGRRVIDRVELVREGALR